jgi:hypothetical protein
VVPGAASAGAFNVTVGFSVSGRALIVSVAAAEPVLPLGSVAVAVTTISVPGEATDGTTIDR